MKLLPERKRLLLFCAAAILHTSIHAQQKPNIIYILADDLGYGDVGCYGQKTIKTPNIDELASNGMLFTQHYAGAPVCAPSRAVLMTGRDLGHARVRGNYETGPHGFGAGLELRDEDITLGEVLKARGYATAVIGKWGMGAEGTTGLPHKQGFDYSYGFLNQAHAHYQFPEYLYRNGNRIEITENKAGERQSYSNNLFTNEAIRFIASKKSETFFLYLAYTTPHAELLVPDDSIFNSYKNKFKEAPYIMSKQGGSNADHFGAYHSQTHPKAAYATCISHLDKCIGEVVSFLKANNLYNNTLIVFSSDNGPAKEGGAHPGYFNSNGGLRGMKRDVYEGGIREPMIAVWPGKIKAGSKTDLISAFQDVMPTLAEVSGKPLEKTILTEGLSFLPTLTGKEAQQKKHAYLYWEFHENKTSDQAVRKGNWKAVRHAPDSTTELYDLSKDWAEQNNVARQYPEIVKEMERIMKKARVPNSYWPLKTSADAAKKKTQPINQNNVDLKSVIR